MAAFMAVAPCFAAETNDGHYEYLFEEKNATDNQVLIKADTNVMQQGNAIRIAFEKKFKSEKQNPAKKLLLSLKNRSILRKEPLLSLPNQKLTQK